MAIDHATAGPNSVPAYQLSGVPFVTSSSPTGVTTTPYKITFPYVSRFMVVRNLSTTDLRVGFSANGVSGSNYFVVSSGSTTPRLEVRCKEVYFMQHSASPTGFSLLAGLTSIPNSAFPVLTGSVTSGSAAFEGIG